MKEIHANDHPCTHEKPQCAIPISLPHKKLYTPPRCFCLNDTLQANEIAGSNATNKVENSGGILIGS